MRNSEDSCTGFIAVHLGAGCHSKSKFPKYKSLCNNACTTAMNLIKAGHSSVHVVTEVISILEDSSLTNAGYGSNLTTDGLVECDASIMDSDSDSFAAVGALNGIKNPIKVAYDILMHQNEKEHDLVPPMILVGEGAKQWAVKRGFQGVLQENMVSQAALKSFRKAKQVLARAEQRKEEDYDQKEGILNLELQNPKNKELLFESHIDNNLDVPSKRQKLARPTTIKLQDSVLQDEDTFKVDGKDMRLSDGERSKKGKIGRKPVNYPPSKSCQTSGMLDTVGAICVDSRGNVCSGVSSGGILLKHPGRIGQAGVYGAGCWVRQSTDGNITTACSSSGCGEQLIKTCLAKSYCEAVLNKHQELDGQTFTEILGELFLNANCLQKDHEKLVGCMAILKKNADECDAKYMVIDDGSGISDKGSHWTVDLMISHTTHSFCVGFMNSGGQKPRFLMLEMAHKDGVGKTFVSQAYHFRL